MRYQYIESPVFAWRRPKTPPDWRHDFLTRLQELAEKALGRIPGKAERPTPEAWATLRGHLARDAGSGFVEIRCGNRRRVWALWWHRGRGWNESAGFRFAQGAPEDGAPRTKRSRDHGPFHITLRSLTNGLIDSQPGMLCRLVAPGSTSDLAIHGQIFPGRISKLNSVRMMRRMAPLARRGRRYACPDWPWRIVERTANAVLIQERVSNGNFQNLAVFVDDKLWRLGHLRHVPLGTALELIAVERIAMMG